MHPFFRGPLCNEAYTITFGDRGENEKGMQIIGKSARKGLSVSELKTCKQKLITLGIECNLVDLGQLLPSRSTTEAAVLIIRGGVSGLLKDKEGENAVYRELRSMPKDKMHKDKYGNVVNSHQRHNNCMADYSQQADIPNGKGTVVSFKDYPMTGKLRDVQK